MDCNYGNTSWLFPNDGGACPTCGGPVSGLAQDSTGNLYVTEGTLIHKIIDDNTIVVVAAGFTRLAGLAVTEVTGTPILLAADGGSGEVYVVNPQTAAKAAIASGLNDPRAVDFAEDPVTGERYILVAEANRVLRLPSPMLTLHKDLLGEPKVLVTNKLGRDWLTPSLQTELSRIKVDFSVLPAAANTIYLKLQTPDPKDSAPYADTTINDNKTPDSTALSATTVALGSDGRPVTPVVLDVNTDKAGNNYVVEFYWDAGLTRLAGATKPITVWKRYFYESDPMFLEGSDITLAVAQGATFISVENATIFSNGDQVRVWDRKTPVNGRISDVTVDRFDSVTLVVTGGTIDFDFPKNDVDGPLYPTVTRLNGGSKGEPDRAAMNPLFNQAFTQWMPADPSTNFHPLVPFVAYFTPTPPEWANEGAYISARWEEFFDHGFPKYSANDEREDYVHLINAGKQISGGPPDWLGITRGTGDVENWSIIANDEIEAYGPGCSNPPCLTLVQIAAYKRNVIVHELAHQFNVNCPWSVGGHDAQTAWCGKCGTSNPERCIMALNTSNDDDDVDDRYFFHILGGQLGDVFDVRDHALSLLVGEMPCPPP